MYRADLVRPINKLVAILQTNCKDKQHLTLNDEIKKNTVIDDSCHNSIFGNWFIAFIY